MASYDNYDYDDNDYDELSKAVIPQQFYKDLDDELDDLPRHEYTKRLLKLCTDDCYRVSDYRTRLSETALDQIYANLCWDCITYHATLIS